jgi:Zn-finger nucleic acid-binding protein
MLCPKCQKSLLVVERNQIELDYCLACKGFWFDEGEFALLPKALNLNMDLPDFSKFPKITCNEKACPCPRCQKKMDKITLGSGSDLVLDRCPKGDGMWFDSGELANVVKSQHAKTISSEEKIVRFLGEVFNLEES